MVGEMVFKTKQIIDKYKIPKEKAIKKKNKMLKLQALKGNRHLQENKRKVLSLYVLNISGLKRANDLLSKNKLAILKRDNFQCQVCGTKKNLTIHHHTMQGKIFHAASDYKLEWCITLCARHHIVKHLRDHVGI